MIRFRENFSINNKINAAQEEQKKKMMLAQQNVKGKIEEGKKVAGEVKVKVEDWLRGKKGEAVNKLDGVTDIKTRWLLAQQQKQETEEVYNKAEKDWFTFSKGGLWYQNYLEDKAGVKIAAKKSNIEDRFNTRASEIKKLIQVYKEKNDNKNNVGSMDRTIQLETEKMAEKVNFGKNAKNVNNRMSDWYEEQNEFYENINWYVSKIYWISLIVMSVLVLIKFKLENKKLLAVIVLFISIPFLTNYAAAWLFDLHSNNCPTLIPSLGFESGQSKTCQVRPAASPVDCEMGAWGPCNKMCGGGKKSREIVTQPMAGGRPCEETTTSCNTHACKPGETPNPPPPGPPPPKPTDNVLIQMTKKYWEEKAREMADLGNATLQNKEKVCKKDVKQAPDMPSMPSMPSMPNMDKMGEMGKGALSSAKNLGYGALDKAGRIKEKAELLADDAAKKVGETTDDITSKTEDRFDIIQSECLGKYCR